MGWINLKQKWHLNKKPCYGVLFILIPLKIL